MLLESHALLYNTIICRNGEHITRQERLGYNIDCKTAEYIISPSDVVHFGIFFFFW